MEKEEGEGTEASSEVKSEEEGKENNNSNSNSGGGGSRKRKADCVDRDTNTVVTGRRRLKIKKEGEKFELWPSAFTLPLDHVNQRSNRPGGYQIIQSMFHDFWPPSRPTCAGWMEEEEERYWALGGFPPALPLV